MDNFDTRYLGTPANQPLETPLAPEQKKSMIDSAAQNLTEFLEILRIDHRSDHNTRRTPNRVARMYPNELLAGRFSAPPRLSEFDSVETSGGDYLVDRTAPRGLDVRVRSVHMCKTHRGVLASYNSQMISSACYGLLKDDERLKAEFFEECPSLEGKAAS